MLGQVKANHLPQMVMGGFHFQNGAIFPYCDMAVAGAGIKMQDFTGKFFIHGLNQLGCLLSRDFVGTMVQNPLLQVRFLIGQSHQVAPVDSICCLHRNAYAQSFQRRTSGIALDRVITQNGKVCHIAARLHIRRHHAGKPYLTFSCQQIHSRGSGVFQGSLPPQSFQRQTSHSISQYNDVFQTSHPLTAFVFQIRTHVFVYPNIYIE